MPTATGKLSNKLSGVLRNISDLAAWSPNARRRVRLGRISNLAAWASNSRGLNTGRDRCTGDCGVSQRRSRPNIPADESQHHRLVTGLGWEMMRHRTGSTVAHAAGPELD